MYGDFMTDIQWTSTTAKLGSLKPWDGNPKTSTGKQHAQLTNSFDELGQFQTVAISPTGDVYDGHQRLSALLAKHGADYEVQALQSSRPLTDEERRKIAIYSRQIGAWDWDELSAWDAGELMEWGFDEDLLKDWGQDYSALSAMLESEEVPPEETDAEPQTNRADELREEWGVEPGQMWRLPSRTEGQEHRLICGDCTDEAVAEQVLGSESPIVVFTDPPYGVSVGKKNVMLNSFQKAGRNLTDIVGDDLPPSELKEMLLPAFRIVKDKMADDCSVFVTAPQGGDLGSMMMMMDEAGLCVRHVLNWVKNSQTFSMGRLDYDYKHEPILFTWGKKHRKNKGLGFGNSCWEIDKPRSSAEHPTMKPPELYEQAYNNHSNVGEVVYEPFSGSGTAVIAAENLSRQCRAVEISPAYVAVALQRYQDAFDITPELIG